MTPRPSQQLAAILSGTLPLTEASPAVQSWARLPIYHKAVKILERPKHERLALIESEPASFREELKREVRRVYRLRQSSSIR